MSRLLAAEQKRILAPYPAVLMTNVEYEMIVHALDAARLKFGLELIAPDGAAERIRLLINLTLKAGESAIFAPAVAMMASQTHNLRAETPGLSADSLSPDR